jgi:hypothetical protein
VVKNEWRTSHGLCVVRYQSPPVHLDLVHEKIAL